MSNQPTELDRALWWREGWRRAYNRAEVEDRLTARIFIRELTAIIRLKMACQIFGEQKMEFNNEQEETNHTP